MAYPEWFDEERLREEDPEEFEGFFDQNYILGEMSDDEVRGKNVLDLGANAGYFSMRCLVAGARKVVCVEPSPPTFARLHRNLGPAPGAVLVNAAVFDGVAEWIGLTNENKHSKFRNLGEEGADKVQSVSLGDLLSFFPPGDDSLVLKVDVEGAEYDVMLSAAARDVRRFELIYLEVHPAISLPEHPARKKSFLEDYMSFLGYELVHRGQVFWWEYDWDGNVIGCHPIDDLQCLKLRRT
jgi:FkbM family methyltransferase